MHRPHRDLDRKGQHEGQEDQHLLGHAQRQLVPDLDVEAAGGQIQVDHGHHGEERPQQGVEEELEGGVDAVRAAPDPDDDVHRDERGLEEHVEEHPVGRGEHADHQPGEDQEGAQVLVGAVLDDLPAGHHHHDGDEGGEQHHPYRQTVDAQRVVDAQALDPGFAFDELQRRRRGVETGIERDGDGKAQHRAQQRQPAREIGALLITDRQHDDAADDRYPDGGTQPAHAHCLCHLFHDRSIARGPGREGTRTAGRPAR